MTWSAGPAAIAYGAVHVVCLVEGCHDRGCGRGVGVQQLGDLGKFVASLCKRPAVARLCWAVCVLNPSVVVTARVGNGFKAWSGRGQPTALHGGQQYLVMLALGGRNKAQWAAKGAGHGTCE